MCLCVYVKDSTETRPSQRKISSAVLTDSASIGAGQEIGKAYSETRRTLDLRSGSSHALADFKTILCSHYKKLEAKPFSWLKGVKAVDAGTYYLNLAMVEKTLAESMMSSLASSSAHEIKRQEYLYSRPKKQTLVCLDQLFYRFKTKRTSTQGQITSHGQRVEAAGAVQTLTLAEPPATRSKVALSPSPSNVPVVVVSEGGDAQCKLQSVKRVAIYGGAGCEKTSCLMKAARMYADEQLWPGARALLFWKLRDP